MKQKAYHHYFIRLLTFFILFCLTSFADAELKLESVYPTLGIAKQNLTVKLKGSGFDLNTRVSMFPDVSNQRTVISSFTDLPGPARSIIIDNNTAFIACDEGGISILDISNIQNPENIARLDTSGEAWGMELVGNILYVADGSAGIQIIDVSSHSSPILLGSADTPGIAYDISIKNNIAFVADKEKGLQLIDVSNLNQPVLIDNIPTESIWTIEIKGNFAYMGGKGFQILDISTPSVPKIISEPVNTDICNFKIIEDRAYVITNQKLIVFDMSSPYSPSFIAQTNIVSSCYLSKITWDSHNTIYITDAFKGFQMMDISDSHNIQSIGFIETQGAFNTDIAVIDETAVIADGNKGLQIIDVRPSSFYSGIGLADTPGDARAIVVNEQNIAYVADSAGGLQVFDVKNPLHPDHIGSLDLYTQHSSVDIEENDGIVYIANNLDGLHIIDVSDPAAPSLLAVFKDSKTVWGVAAKGSYAYITDMQNGLQILDMTDPTNPVLAGKWGNTGGTTIGICVENDIAYIAGYFSNNNSIYGLHMMDIRDSSNLFLINSVGSADNMGAGGLAVMNHMAYVTYSYMGATTSKMEIINVSQPGSAFVAGITELPASPFQVDVWEKTAYVANYRDGVQAIDVSIPENPKKIGEVYPPGYATDIDAKDGIGYVACGKAGVAVMPLPLEISPVAVNDDSSVTVEIPGPPVPGHYTLRVFNENESAELHGAVSFVSTEESYLLDTKAIIITGTDSDNKIWEETKTAADHAYKSLLYQGYTAESIYYLSPDTESEGVDETTTLANISGAITTWVRKEPPATELLLYLVDHGENEIFIINQNEKLSAAELAQWLDDLQADLNIPVILVYDACHSGSFLPKLMPAADRERILISSTSSEEYAYFLDGGKISFSYQFWDSVYRGEKLYDSFLRGREQMKDYQTAFLDADGDGSGNEPEDETLVNNITIRRSYHPQTTIPYIHSVSEPQIIHDTATGTIEAGVSYIQDGTEIQRVWAIITPPDFDPADDSIPVIDNDLKEIELRPAGGGKYSGTWAGFTKNGTYKITVCAMNRQGLYALFRNTTVTRESAYIISVSGGQVLSGQNTEAAVWAALNKKYESTVLTRVWAEIIPPNLNSPVMETDLSDPQNDGIYESMFTDFSEEGTYQIFFYAEDEKGYTSPAVSSYVTREGSGEYSDRFEPDDSYGLARFHLLGQLQSHNFHIYDDTDWCRFFLAGGVTYNLQILSDVNLCDTEVEIFQWDGTQPVPQDSVYANEDGLYWTSPEKGIYYIRVRNAFPEKFGQNITYDLEVYRPIAGSTGIIQGTLTDPQGRPVSEAQIFTDGGGSDLSRENGFFTIEHPLGTFILHVEADGFDMYEREVTINENETLIENIILSPTDVETGDVNGDGEISLKDALLALRISAGESEFSQAVCRYAHVNGDLRIGPEEAVYILQVISEMKP
ncbi:MAG: carboxypeptidase regulatory-like domain-containing protein [Desulfococcaceae bacterium]|jgi:hypothetical protein|nr:carboxypeptidase regulatory-like domain-containing protein [Desulfococcaceae bacterium]